jgi:RNA polymerase sigma factor (sigma-70 family)
MSDIALPNTGLPELPRAERLLSDELLARLTGRGSARAFAALYERHHQALYRYCRSIVRNDHDAQDALQSAMMRAYTALRARERELTVRPWLFRIAHNEAISILRRRGPEHEYTDDCEQLDGDVEHTLEVSERLASLVADLQSLPERQRGALLMRELSGLSIEEIAGALSISSGTAKQTLFEARNSLHEISEGRAMRCESVREAISQRDGRVLRGRRMRAHLRECEECRDFRAAIGARGADLSALVPLLPPSAAGAILGHLLAHAGPGHMAAATSASGGATAASGGATTVSSGASLGGHAAASILAKGVAGVVVLAAATAGTVHLTAARHHRGPVMEKSSTGARGTGATSAGGGADLLAAPSPGNAKSHLGSSSLQDTVTGTRAAAPTGTLRAYTPASVFSGQGGSRASAHSQAGDGARGTQGTGGRPHAHKPQSGGRSPRHARPHAPASSPSRHPRQGGTRGEAVTKHQSPAAEATQPDNGGQGSVKSAHEGPSAGTSGEAQQTSTQPAR